MRAGVNWAPFIASMPVYMIKLLLWSCVVLVALTALLFWLYAIGTISIMAFALLSAAVIVIITLAHVVFVVNSKLGSRE